MSRVSDDVLALPIVAHRGLWDKFADPQTVGAIRRAYLRGVPTLIDPATSGASIGDLLALVTDPAVNRRRQPAFVVGSGPMLQPQTMRAVTDAPVYALQQSGAADSARSVWLWSRPKWVQVGRYVPLAAIARGLRAEDVRGQCRTPIVLFESANVATDLVIAARHRDIDDNTTLTTIRRHAPDARVLRVSDLVELDQLEARIREAA